MQSKFFTIVCAFLLILPVMAQDANVVDGCVTDYAAGVDYFPDKVDVNHADNFTIEYFDNYKVLTVSDAYEGADAYHYVLVQCGTPAPSRDEFPDNTQFVEVPTGDVITLSTTQLPVLSQLGLLDHLVGVDSLFYISDADVIAMGEADEVVEVGFGSEVNVEVVLEIAPDMVLTYGFDPATDAHPVLLDAGIFTVLDASWRELSPLGRAEWIKFTASFYNAEADATVVYDDTVAAYAEAQELAQSVDIRPNVLMNTFLSYQDAWSIPGSETYVGQLVHDAGGNLLLGEEGATASQGLSFEVVYEGGVSADVWLIDTFGVSSLTDLLAQDERFGDFDPFQSDAVWNNNRDTNVNGGNNYYELGVTNPHLVLQDLVAIFHPDLLPDHDFSFYQRLGD
jgi:iron complex transport system substrate-binding protein